MCLLRTRSAIVRTSLSMRMDMHRGLIHGGDKKWSQIRQPGRSYWRRERRSSPGIVLTKECCVKLLAETAESQERISPRGG